MPVLARVYHIPPSEQGKLTLEQFTLIRADFEQMQDEG
jgi:hypothetical protein